MGLCLSDRVGASALKGDASYFCSLLLITSGEFGASSKARGANALIREYAKSVVSPSRLAAADGVVCVASLPKKTCLGAGFEAGVVRSVAYRSI
jgi:hypothetical protein